MSNRLVAYSKPYSAGLMCTVIVFWPMQIIHRNAMNMCITCLGCCIYEKPKLFGESSDESGDDDCTNHCRGHKKKCYQHGKGGEHHEHSHGKY